MRGNTVDLAEEIGKAVRLAKSGDFEALEIELRALQRIGLENVGSLSLRLRALAKAVRSHPSFHSASAA